MLIIIKLLFLERHIKHIFDIRKYIHSGYFIFNIIG